jgi:hypothetical protein
MAVDLVAATLKLLESTFAVSFVGALAGAAAGAWGAQRVIERVRRREELLREIRNTNAAVMVAFTIANTALGMKAQLVRPMADRFRKDLEALRKHVSIPQLTGAPKGKFSFQADLQTFFAPSLPVDTLKTLVFDRISAFGKALSLVVQIENAIAGLSRSTEERRGLIADFKTHPMDDAWAFRYFGEKSPSGHTHREYADLVDVISSFTDDVIYFSGSLVEELVAHAQILHDAFSKRYGQGAPKVSSPDFSGPKKSGLYPSVSDYGAWEQWITERGDPKKGEKVL